MLNEIQLDSESETGTFVIDAIGSFDKKRYVGQFVVKAYLNPIDKINADKLRREMLGVNPDSAGMDEKALALCLSELKYRIISAGPSWFPENGIGGSTMRNENIVIMVWDLARKVQEEYSKMLQEEADKMQEAINKAIESGKVRGQPQPEEEEDDTEAFFEDEETVLPKSKEEIEGKSKKKKK